MCAGYYPKFGGFLAVVIYHEGVAWDVGCQRFPPNLGEIAGDLSTYQEIPLRTLIAANDSPFSAPFHPYPRGARIILKSADR